MKPEASNIREASIVVPIVQALLLAAVAVINILFFGWDWRSVFVLFWLETGTIGILLIIGILRTHTGGSVSSPRSASRLTNITLAAIFGLLYSVVLTVPLGLFYLLTDASGHDFWEIDWVAVIPWWLCMAAMRIVASFFQPAPTGINAVKLFTPFLRLVILNTAAILGAVIILILDVPAVAALILVGLYSGVEIFMIMVSATRPGRASLLSEVKRFFGDSSALAQLSNSAAVAQQVPQGARYVFVAPALVLQNARDFMEAYPPSRMNLSFIPMSVQKKYATVGHTQQMMYVVSDGVSLMLINDGVKFTVGLSEIVDIVVCGAERTVAPQYILVLQDGRGVALGPQNEVGIPEGARYQALSYLDERQMAEFIATQPL